MSLERETKWFADNRADLLTKYAGKYVLVQDERIQGSFDTAQSAYEAGIALFGAGGDRFLVKQVLATDPVEHMPAVWVGTLRAAI